MSYNEYGNLQGVADTESLSRFLTDYVSATQIGQIITSCRSAFNLVQYNGKSEIELEYL